MKTTTFHLMRRYSVLAFLMLLLTSISFSQGTFKHFYGNGKGISVEKTSTGYLLIVERASGYEAIATDNGGNELSTVNLGPLCDKIKRLPNGYGKLTKGDASTHSSFQYLDNSGVILWDESLGAIGVAYDFLQKPDGSFIFFATRSLGVPYGDSYFLNLDINGNVTGLFFLVTVDYGPGAVPDTIFTPYSGLMVQKTDGSIILALSGVEDDGGGFTSLPATRIVHLNDTGNTIFSQEMTFEANVPFEVTEYVDLAATDDNEYISVLHRGDFFTGDQWEIFIHEKPGYWGFVNGYGLNSVFSSGSAEYFSIVPTANGGAVTSEFITRNEYDPNAGTTTVETTILLRNDFNGNNVWMKDYPNYAYDIFELADQRLAFTGQESGDAYLVVLNADGSLACPTPAGFTKIGSYNNHEYYLSDTGYNWADARSLASANDGYIASINDAGENTFLKDNISELVFIGLNDELVEGNLKWDSGEPVGYTNLNVSCIPCGFNDASKDYGVMMPWDGTWGFDNQWVVRKFVLEKLCATPSEMRISYDCPTTFPQDIMHIPVTVKNNTSAVQPAKTLYLHQDYYGGFPLGYTPNKHGQVAIPSLQPGASASAVLNTTSIGKMPDLKMVDGSFNFYDNYGKYYLSFDSTGFAETKEFDYYCKKYTTDLAVEIKNIVPTYGNPDDITYSVEITNKGTEDAHNIRAQLLEEYIGGGPYIFPNIVEVTVTGAGVVVATKADGASPALIECLIKTLPAGSKVSCDVIFHVGFGLPTPNQYLVNASVTSGHLINDPDRSNNTDSHTFFRDLGCATTIPGFTYLATYNGHTYYMSDSIYTWDDAKALANSNGGYLATIGNQVENSFLQNQLGFNMVFIGLQDATSEGAPTWANGEAGILDLSYNNSSANDYAVMNFWAGTWEFYNVWVRKKFIMEKDCLPPIVSPKIATTPTSLPQIHEVFPNPANNQVFVSFSTGNLTKVNIQIFDELGRVYLEEMRELPAGQSVQAFDTSNLPKGMYFVKSGQSSDYQKFVKM